MIEQAKGEIKSRVDAYCEAWVSTLAGLLSRHSSVVWHPEPVPDAARYVPGVRVGVTLGPGLEGQQWAGFSEGDANELLRVVANQPGSDPAEAGPPRQEAIVDLVEQWAAAVASSLTPNFEKSSLRVELEGMPAESGLTSRLLRVGNGSVSISAQLILDATLVSSLARLAEVAVDRPTKVASTRIEELVRQGNLDLLMDVELGVMLQFGCRQTTLREVLELATGAVLELDREIEQPVDLLLNGRVVARGEVVVIDGNYGLRVTDVASAQQRVNSL